MKRYNLLFLILTLFVFFTPACTGDGAPSGDNDVFDNDEGNAGDIDQVDVTDNAEAPVDTVEEPTEETDEPEIDTQDDPLVPFRWIEGEWYCAEGDAANRGRTVLLSIDGHDENFGTKIKGVKPCSGNGYSKQIESMFTFYGFKEDKLDEPLCTNGNFNQETGELTFDAYGVFYLYRKRE